MIDISRFHNDLKAAILARAPVEIDEKPHPRSSPLTLEELDHLEGLLCPHFSNGASGTTGSDANVSACNLEQVLIAKPDLPPRYCAALRTFGLTDSMIPVLDGLSTRRIAQNQITQVVLRAFIYLILLFAIAFYGLVLFKSKIIPLVDELRVDIALAAGISPPEPFGESAWITLIVATVGIAFVSLVLWMSLGGATKIAMYLGGTHYLRCRVSNSALRTMQLLLNAGSPVEEAVAISCELNAADDVVKQGIQAVAGELYGNEQLNSIGDYLEISANQRLAYMNIAAPSALICTVGAVVSLTYCLVLFWPVITVLHDLTRLGG